MWLTLFVVLILLPVAFGGQIGFTMTRGQINGSRIRFERVVTNFSADLDPARGTFRCHVPGLYYFGVTALGHQPATLKLSVRKNDTPVITLASSSDNYKSLYGSIVISLQENDVVYPSVESGQLYELLYRDRALTSFTGFRISKEVRDYIDFAMDDDTALADGFVDESDEEQTESVDTER
ncbi:complement C1q protein 3-like [Tropilaelaps mercedesae]|uniref:Complement C1q protein 3-like n=1 Tax=Tropilaelaps mercedesae TaxID=418985 RepID=A0A1V9XWB3_9ACAR|nr:complement C1q protein 3-like [Tropilaelaps mercedesae]